MAGIARRTARVMLVVIPIVALGFFLGMRTASSPVHPPLRNTLELRPGPGADGTSPAALPEELVGVQDGQQVTAAAFETTVLPLAEACAEYDRRAAAEQWEFDARLTGAVPSTADESVRVYVRRGAVRIVVIGSAQGTPPERQVTVYSGCMAR